MIESVLKDIINSVQRNIKNGERKKVITTQLEEKVIAGYSSLKLYDEAGGFFEFSSCVNEFILKGIFIVPSTSSVLKKGSNKMREWYWVCCTEKVEGWGYEKFLEVSDLLDISFYKNHRVFQTNDEWMKIKLVHEFLKNKHLYIPISREQRSLQIFNSMFPWLENVPKEKWLGSDSGKLFLKRLKLTLSSLVAYQLREPFTYFKNPRSQSICEILVLEGLSAYDTCKRLLNTTDSWIFGPAPDLIIFGAGYQIIGNFEYILELEKEPESIHVLYAGDLDPEGYKIYLDFKAAHPKYRIELATFLYEWMLGVGMKYKQPIITQQKIQESQFNRFLYEFMNEETKYTLKLLKEKNERIAQEVLNFETLS